jgi:transposase-like protein
MNTLEPPTEIDPALLWLHFPEKTQPEIASAMGIHPTTFAKWVTKKRKASASSRVLAAKLYAEWSISF